MQDEGFLLAIAQIAVTLAGFSGLVVAIRGAPPTAWHPRDIWSLSWMLARVSAPFHGAPAAIVSFLSVTRGTDLDSRQSGDVCFYDRIRGGNGSFGSTSHEIGASATCPLFSHGRDAPVLTCGFLSGLGIAGVFSQARTGFFVLGLVACLLVSALSLVVFLVVLARTARARS
jgi:hypothetical protein